MTYPPRIVPDSGCSFAPRQAYDGGFTMAFQPIFDTASGKIFAHEALVRSAAGGPAADVMRHINCKTRYSFDRRCRVKAIAMASALGLTSRLSVNCMPDVVMDPDTCIRATLMAADHYKFDPAKLIFEFNEKHYLRDPQHLRAVMAGYRRHGFLTAIDNFGTGFSGLGALCDVQTDMIKLDKTLIRTIDGHEEQQRMVRSIIGLCDDLGVRIIAEGVETQREFDTLRGLGVTHVQGFYLREPLIERLCDTALVPLPVAA
ncbi:MAG: EAL domain-containing protein [Alphaproteobacteria bacterium]|nr:EAL domain-containing protein [Alphaproteobacteria bacterium]